MSHLFRKWGDKVIKDRKEFNDEDMSLYEKNCDFKRYNTTDKKID
jgi:hypothetical protein